jgi:hypothetical protein
MCRARNWMPHLYLWCDNFSTLNSLKFRASHIINISTVAEKSQLLYFQSRFYDDQLFVRVTSFALFQLSVHCPLLFVSALVRCKKDASCEAHVYVSVCNRAHERLYVWGRSSANSMRKLFTPNSPYRFLTEPGPHEAGLPRVSKG